MKISEREIMVLGDEAVSWGAIDSGMKSVYAYPGTPSTEIFEGIEHIVSSLDDGRIAKWTANEKVAYEMALGTSYTGHRALVCMKHVGLNVAMDAFMNSALTGIRGGFVVAVADDPSMHSSQNEQDSRYLADFAHLPCLEPSTPQEAYDYTCQAFEISEILGVPVMVRLVTRLSHSRGVITRKENMNLPECLGIPPEDTKNDWVLIPSIAKRRYRQLREKLPKMLTVSAQYNKTSISGHRLGVVTCGMGRAYFNQLCREYPALKEYNRLDVCSYPLSLTDIRKFIKSCEEIYVFEENYPYLEDKIRDMGQGKRVYGRRDKSLPMDGELNPIILKKCMELPLAESKKESEVVVPARPPRLCDGCGHRDAFNSMKDALKNIGVDEPRIFGDIGCYTLGVMPPFDMINTCVEMGASVGMTLGAAEAGLEPSIGVIGDSTFFHSGLPTLISMAKSKTANANLVIVDNKITGMTGQQPTVAIDIFEDIARSFGFSEEQIHVLKPLPQKHEENVKYLENVFSQKRPDIIIFRRECVQALRKKLYQKYYQK
ncbi:MAG: hypothetical protein KAQ98_06705 [Bacteriovoracaceae bacterium]|nr:hypothetical protein [Bacteriovoracaceae bacterium]